MAYTKQTWSCGDTITDEKMNHIEDGIANAVEYDLIIDIGGDTIIKGDYASIADKMHDGGVLNGIAYASSPYGDDDIYSHYVMSFAHHSLTNGVIYLQFYKVHPGSGVPSSSVEVDTYTVDLASDNTLSSPHQYSVTLYATA